jgi:hypothetical protein
VLTGKAPRGSPSRVPTGRGRLDRNSGRPTLHPSWTINVREHVPHAQHSVDPSDRRRHRRGDCPCGPGVILVGSPIQLSPVPRMPHHAGDRVRSPAGIGSRFLRTAGPAKPHAEMAR